MPSVRLLLLGFLAFFLPLTALASESVQVADFTTHPIGYSALVIFGLAYVLVMAEDFLHLRKSKPVIIAAGISWGLYAWLFAQRRAKK